MINLLLETIAVLEDNNVFGSDVEWCGSETFGWFSWKDFEDIAKDIEYDDSFGTSYIPMDLVIVGHNWWLERGEYDGSEWWEFKKKPEKPNEYKKLIKLIDPNCFSLKELNQD